MRNLGAIDELAKKQHGVISRAQLDALGEPSSTIDHALKTGLLTRVHKGVYRLAGTPHERGTSLWAALHLAGDGAVLSHLSAAWHWRLEGLGKSPPHVIDVSIPADRRVSKHRALRVHRTRSLLLGKDYATLAGIPVTSISRTLVDLCEVLSESDLEHAFDSVVRRSELNRAAVVEALFRLREGRPSLDKLATIANRKENGCTQSWLEDETRQVLRAANFPLPWTQHELRDRRGWFIGRFDFAWPDRKVVLMVDSWEWHKGPEAFEKDRRQIAQLGSIQWWGVPVTYKRLKFERDAFLFELRHVLAVENRPRQLG